MRLVSRQVDTFHFGGAAKGDKPRVLLVRPPQTFFYGVWPRGPRLSVPIGLLGIASFLKSNDVDVSIYDSFVESGDFSGADLASADRFKRPSSNVGLAQRWLSWFEASRAVEQGLQTRTVQSDVHFGATWEQMEKDIAALEPDIVGVTNLFRENTEETKRFARLVRRVLPQAKIVVGGPNANAMPEKLMEECQEIDVVGLGDGEELMLAIVRQLEVGRSLTGVPNLVLRRECGGVMRTKSKAPPVDLDVYGEQNYGLVRLSRYFEYERNGIMARNKYLYPGAERAVSMVTSRGCPYACTFCSIQIHSGKKFRRHSVEYIVSHVRHLVRDLGVKHIHFEDDNLTLDRERFKEFLKAVIDQSIEFTWDTPNGVFAEALDVELMELMKLSGCVYIIIGVESGDQWVLDNLVRKQPLKLSTVLQIFKDATKVGLDIHAFYIIGFPKETLVQIERTLDFAYTGLVKYGVVPHLSLARADPGTALYREAVETNTLARDVAISNAAGVRSDMFERNLISTQEFSAEQLEEKNEAFHKKCIRFLMKDRLLYLLWNPKSLFGVFSQVIWDTVKKGMSFEQSLVKLFWCGLLYKNTMSVKKYRAVKV